MTWVERERAVRAWMDRALPDLPDLAAAVAEIDRLKLAIADEVDACADLVDKMTGDSSSEFFMRESSRERLVSRMRRRAARIRAMARGG